MHIVHAIAAHVAWKRRLRRIVAGLERMVPSDAVWHDDLCDLGLWMHGEGQRMAGHPAFDAAFDAHVEFHRCAGDVVQALEHGDGARAEALMAAGTACDLASTAIVHHLEELAAELDRRVSVRAQPAVAL